MAPCGELIGMKSQKVNWQNEDDPMRCTIQVEMDNDAFDDYPFELRNIVFNAMSTYEVNGGSYFKLYDSNGNNVGQMVID